ncbi:MAG: formimidoylglutamate deiminase [Nannocystaceae bacterium]
MNQPPGEPASTCTYMAAYGLQAGVGVFHPWVRVDRAGCIVAMGTGVPTPAASDTTYDLGHRILVPGLVNAHSHAFQRLIRGHTQARGAHDPSSFWSWRDAMYNAAGRLDPKQLYRATRDCFAEMVASGITCVGEFHYVHHQPDGTPYPEANELSHRVIEAAADTGIRLTLLEVYYARSGHGASALAEQRRFCDPSVEAYLARVDRLRALQVRYPGLRVGLAPHSIRAVGLRDLEAIARYAQRHDMVVHTHVSEQPLENAQCRDEHNCTPTQVLARAGLLARPRRFTAVHAIHVDARDLELLAGQNVCACPTTEADLADGIVPAHRYLEKGTNLCLGSDSNAVIDLIQEARLLEMHTRLLTGARLCLAAEGPEATTRLGPALWKIASSNGAIALGRPDLGQLAVGHPFDAVVLKPSYPSVSEDPEAAFDACLCAGTAAAVEQVYIAGKRVR